MNKAVKIIGMTLLVLMFVIGGLLAYVLFAVDPNDYKSQIEQAARDQGVELNIKGDLSLNVLPNLAIVIGETGFESRDNGIRPSRFDQASLVLSWTALLHQQIAVKALEVNGADFNLTRAEQAAAIAAAPATAAKPVTTTDNQFAVAIDRFVITDSQLSLEQDGQSHHITGLNLTTGGVNSDGKPFGLSSQFQYQGAASETPVAISLDADIAYDQSNGLLTLTKSALEVAGLLPEPLTINLAGAVDIHAEMANLTDLSATLGGLQLKGRLKVSDYLDKQGLEGSINLTTDQGRELIASLTGEPLQTRNAKALSHLALRTDISGSVARLQLGNLTLALDNSTFTGNLAFVTATPRSLNLELKGDKLVVDDYLAPVEEEQGQSANTPSGSGAAAALFAPIAGPLALLDGGSGKVNLSVEQLVYDGIPLSKLQLVLNSKGQQLDITNLATQVFDGQVKASGRLNLAGKTPQLTLNKQVSAINLEKAMAHLAKDVDIKGTLTMDFTGTTAGNDSDSLLQNLQGKGMLTVDNPELASINLEQNYCELAALVEKTPARTEPWPAGTKLNTLSSQYHFDQGKLILDQYSSGIGNLKVRGDGSVNLMKESFNIKVITNLQGDRTSENGCTVKSKRVRDKDIPLLCKDNFATAGAKSCKPDPDFVKQLLQSELLDKVIGDEDDDKSDPVKGLLRGLLNR